MRELYGSGRCDYGHRDPDKGTDDRGPEQPVAAFEVVV